MVDRIEVILLRGDWGLVLGGVLEVTRSHLAKLVAFWFRKKSFMEKTHGKELWGFFLEVVMRVNLCCYGKHSPAHVCTTHYALEFRAAPELGLTFEFHVLRMTQSPDAQCAVCMCAGEYFSFYYAVYEVVIVICKRVSELF